ncbi:hypothetical protein [Candidatus Hodgkinia cicadicola]
MIVCINKSNKLIATVRKNEVQPSFLNLLELQVQKVAEVWDIRE